MNTTGRKFYPVTEKATESAEEPGGEKRGWQGKDNKTV